MSLAAVGLLLFARAPVDGSFVVDVLPSMILLGLGAGMAFNPVLLAAMSDVEPSEAGLASGVVNTVVHDGRRARARGARQPRRLPHGHPARRRRQLARRAHRRLSRRLPGRRPLRGAAAAGLGAAFLRAGAYAPQHEGEGAIGDAESAERPPRKQREERRPCSGIRTAFSGFSVDDVPRAKQFYGETLGLNVTEEHGMGWTCPPRRRRPRASSIPRTITPRRRSRSSTSRSTDVEEAVDRLTQRRRAVRALRGRPADGREGDRPRPEGPTIAWFKDPAGNILSVLDEDPSRA